MWIGCIAQLTHISTHCKKIERVGFFIHNIIYCMFSIAGIVFIPSYTIHVITPHIHCRFIVNTSMRCILPFVNRGQGELYTRHVPQTVQEHVVDFIISHICNRHLGVGRIVFSSQQPIPLAYSKLKLAHPQRIFFHFTHLHQQSINSVHLLARQMRTELQTIASVFLFQFTSQLIQRCSLSLNNLFILVMLPILRSDIFK